MNIDGDWTVGTYTQHEGHQGRLPPAARRARGQLEHVQRARRRHLGRDAAQGARRASGCSSSASPECQNIVGTEAVVFPAIPARPRRAVATHKKNGVDVSAFTSYLKDKQHDPLPDHGQGAADQPDRAADDREDPDRQRRDPRTRSRT